MEIIIKYSFFADSISKQLKKQKVDFDKEKIKMFQQMSNCALTLRFHELISDKDCDRILSKINKQLLQHLNDHGVSN